MKETVKDLIKYLQDCNPDSLVELGIGTTEKEELKIGLKVDSKILLLSEVFNTEKVLKLLSDSGLDEESFNA